MFFKESLSKRILAVYSFFKDVILYNTNNLAHYHHSNEITVSYLKELLSEFKDMQEEKSFKYNFISTDDGEVSDLSIVITRFLYPTESTISKSIPILISSDDDNEVIDSDSFIKHIKELIIYLSYEYNLSLLKEKSLNVEDGVYLDFIKKCRNIEYNHLDFFYLIYDQNTLRFDDDYIQKVRNKLLYFLSFIDDKNIANRIREDFLNGFDDNLKFISNFRKYFSSFENSINLYLDINKSFANSCFDNPLYSYDRISIL